MSAFFFLFLSIAAAEDTSVKQVQKEYATQEQNWLNNFSNMMNKKSLGDITKGYLDTFLYRPIKLTSVGSQPKPQDPILIFNTIFDESYIPFFIETNGVRRDVIEVIPHKKLAKIRKNPQFWFAQPKRGQNRLSLYRVSKGSSNITLVLQIGHNAPQPKENQVLFHVENPQKKLDSRTLSKHIIDYLVDNSLSLDKIEISGTSKYPEMARKIQLSITSYFKERPTQPPTIIFRDNQHTFAFRYELFLEKGTVWIRSKSDFVGRTEGWFKLPLDSLPPNIRITEISTDGVAFLLKDDHDILWRSGEFFKAIPHWKWHKNMGWLGLPFLSNNHMKSTDALMWDVTDGSLRVNLY